MSSPLARLSDLRILRVIAHVEDALEGHARRLLERLPPGVAHDRAEGILREGPAHQGLHAAVTEYEDAMAAVADSADPGMLVQALRDTERFAHDFYLSLLDRIQDPGLLEIVRGLVQEEAGHVAAAERARDAL